MENNLRYWLAKTAGLSDEEAGTMAVERQNIFRAIKMGLLLPACAETAIQVMLQVFRLVELNGYWQEWIPVLQQAANHPLADTYQVKLLNQLGFLYRLTGDLDRAISVHKNAASLAEQTGEIAELARIYFNLGTNSREARAYQAAENYARLASEAFAVSGTTASRNQAAIANLSGLIAHCQGSYEAALDHFNAAISLWKEAEQIAYLVRSLLNKGLSLEKLSRYEEALQVYDKATWILDDAGLELDKVAVAINRGNIHFHLGQWSQALATYQSADTIHLHRSGNLAHQATIANNLGNVFLEMDELIQATAYLEKAIGLWRQVGDNVMLSNALGTLGDVRIGQEQFSEARAYLEEALHLLNKYPNDAFAQEIKGLCTQRLADISG